MESLIAVWFRAFLIVAATAMNVTQVAGGHYGRAFFTGAFLSFIWWGNTRAAVWIDSRGAQWAYAFGAGCGTVAGMALGRLIG
jgi:hypothetical protein